MGRVPPASSAYRPPATTATERIAAVARRTWLTLILTAAVLVAGILTGTVLHDSFPRLMEHLGWSLAALKQGRLWVLWPGLLFASSPGVRHAPFQLVLFMVGPLEYRCGTRVAAVAFFILGPLASIITALLLWPLHALGAEWTSSYLLHSDMGSSTASLLCWGMVLGEGQDRQLERILTVLTLIALAVLLALKAAFQADHMAAFILGLLVGTRLLCGKAGMRKAAV